MLKLLKKLTNLKVLRFFPRADLFARIARTVEAPAFLDPLTKWRVGDRFSTSILRILIMSQYPSKIVYMYLSMFTIVYNLFQSYHSILTNKCIVYDFLSEKKSLQNGFSLLKILTSSSVIL